MIKSLRKLPWLLALTVALFAALSSSVALGTQDSLWTGSGSGDTTVVLNGSSGTAMFTYDHSVFGIFSGSWEFSVVAQSFSNSPPSGTHNLEWVYSGFHSFFNVRANLDAFIERDGVTISTVNLVNAGPQNCCTTPSAGFTHSGTHQFLVQTGDKYGFRMSGSHFDSAYILRGTLTVDEWPFSGATVPVRPDFSQGVSSSEFDVTQTDVITAPGVSTFERFTRSNIVSTNGGREISATISPDKTTLTVVSNSVGTSIADPGSYSATYALQVDDKDGIDPEVDTDNANCSDDFSIGTTSGTITTRGTQTVTVIRASDIDFGSGPIPSVLVASAADSDPGSAGFDNRAKIHGCGSTTAVALFPGASAYVACGSAFVEVVTGTVLVTFITPDGTETTSEVTEGNTLILDTENFTVSAPAGNPDTVVIVVNGVEIELEAGDPPVSVDVTPPVISGVTATPGTLERPNHKMRPVTVSVDVSDSVDDDVSCQITGVVSNEAVGAKRLLPSPGHASGPLNSDSLRLRLQP